MNKKIKPTVYSILDNDELAREDTWYLIQQVLIKMLDINQGTAFGIVIQGMKYQGISFEAITRAKRKWIEQNPDKINQEIESVRREEEQEYFLEYSGNHIPQID